MGCVLSIEHLEATISSTSTSTTVDVTLGQDVDNCVIFVTFKSASGAANFNTRLPEVWFSDADTITVQRNTGTDIGTITYGLEVVEFDPAKVTVSQGTFTMTGSASTTATVSISGAITDAFMLHNYRTSNTSTTQPGRTLVRGAVTNTTTLTFTRDTISGNIAGRYFLAEALNSEFAVVHDSLSIGSGAEAGSEAVTGDPDIAKSFTIASQSNGDTTDDWDTSGVKVSLVDNPPLRFQFSRANGGASGATTGVIEYQVVTFSGAESVQRDNDNTISGTSVTVALGTSVDLTSATANSPMLFGMGEGNGADGAAELGNWHGLFKLINDGDDVDIAVVSDITPDGDYAWEVIDWDVGAGDTPFSPAFAGTGTLVVTFQVDLPLSPTFVGTGTLAVVSAVDVPLAPTFVGTGTLAVTTTVAQELSPTFVGTGALIVTFSIDVPLSATFAGTGTLVVDFDTQELITTRQLFGRFVVWDPSQLSEAALRKIAYVRQRER